MDELEWIRERDGQLLINRPPSDVKIVDKINEIVRWINSKNDQLL